MWNGTREKGFGFMVKWYRNQVKAVWIFAFFYSSVIALPEKNQIIDKLLVGDGFPADTMRLVLILFHIIGLIAAAYRIRNIRQAKRVLLAGNLGFLLGIALCFLGMPSLWYGILPLMGVATGIWLAAFGWFFQATTRKEDRMLRAGWLIVGANVLLILHNVVNYLLPGIFSLLLMAFLLVETLVFTLLYLKLPALEATGEKPEPAYPLEERVLFGISRPLLYLVLFIFLSSLNIGLLFSIVHPAYSHLGLLSVVFFNIPYIAANIALVRLRKKVRPDTVMTIMIVLVGFSFVSFLILDRGLGSYFAVDIMLETGLGALDLIWWTFLSEMMDVVKSPSKVLGIGLAANALGVLASSFLLAFGLISGSALSVSVMGFSTVLLALLVLPVFYRRMKEMERSQKTLTVFFGQSEEVREETLENRMEQADLTRREHEIAGYLLKGFTYGMIAKDLVISEHTVRRHISNIYSKLGVGNKAQMIEKLTR